MPRICFEDRSSNLSVSSLYPPDRVYIGAVSTDLMCPIVGNFVIKYFRLIVVKDPPSKETLPSARDPQLRDIARPQASPSTETDINY